MTELTVRELMVRADCADIALTVSVLTVNELTVIELTVIELTVKIAGTDGFVALNIP